MGRPEQRLTLKARLPLSHIQLVAPTAAGAAADTIEITGSIPDGYANGTNRYRAAYLITKGNTRWVFARWSAQSD